MTTITIVIEDKDEGIKFTRSIVGYEPGGPITQAMKLAAMMIEHADKLMVNSHYEPTTVENGE